MRIKHAYNTVLNSDSRAKYDSGNRTSQTYKRTEDEEFYGFGKFITRIELFLFPYSDVLASLRTSLVCHLDSFSYLKCA